MKRYKPTEIEPKWQHIWDETQVYRADMQSAKPKYVAMSMFNYPSGAGIHIGHAMNYTISDVKARFKRQMGYESYHPIGWDAFGLPAENFAIKSGVSPQASMAKIIPDYHRQYKAMGWSNDWSREVATHEPEYYRWTQWIFSQMFKHRLAYQDARMQWWCTQCQTVLSNEQVIDGKCWRHDSPEDPLVQQKEVKQWFFKITEYADELLEAIEDLDWTPAVKTAQRNWIGRSAGAEIIFKVKDSDLKIPVFTTRADTIFSGAFVVLAPEHELALQVATEQQRAAVQSYITAAKLKSEVERQSDKEKSGVFTGSYAINPANNELIPIWLGDFVLAGYGTGAVFGDIHDERDFEFLQKFDIPARVTVIPEDEIESQKVINKEYAYTDEGILINSGQFDGMRSEEAREKIVAWLTEQGAATETINYKMRDWSVSRQRYWGAPIPIIYCKGSCGTVLVPDEQLPVVLPDLDDFQPSGDGRSALARATDWVTVECPNCAGPGERETDTLDTYICSSWYMFRFMDPRNSEQIFSTDLINKWAPIDFYNGGDHATAHLLYARFVTRFFTKIGIMSEPEPFKQFLFNGKVTASDGKMFSKSKGNGVDPLEIINSGYGADALRTYLMFAAPLEIWAKWDAQGVPGAHRFLNRTWNLVQEYAEAPTGELDQAAEKSIRRATHQMIAKVTEDINANRYNTAIATAMGTVNEFFKLKVDNLVTHDAWQEALEALVCCVAPFAPHVSEELWHDLGHSDSVHVDHWPKHDPQYLVSDQLTIVVQVNGKVRANITVDAGTEKETILSIAQTDERIAQYVASGIKKSIYVPNKLVNFVV